MYSALVCNEIQQPSTRPFSSAGPNEKSVQEHLNLSGLPPITAFVFNRSDEDTTVRAAFARLRGDVSRPGKSYGKKEASMVRIGGNHITTRTCLDPITSARPRAGQESTKIRSRNLWGIRQHNPEAWRRLPTAYAHHQSLHGAKSAPRPCGVVGELSHLLTHVASKGYLAN